jgi:hypothetical protein
MKHFRSTRPIATTVFHMALATILTLGCFVTARAQGARSWCWVILGQSSERRTYITEFIDWGDDVSALEEKVHEPFIAFIKQKFGVEYIVGVNGSTACAKDSNGDFNSWVNSKVLEAKYGVVRTGFNLNTVSSSGTVTPEPSTARNPTVKTGPDYSRNQESPQMRTRRLAAERARQEMLRLGHCGRPGERACRAVQM